VDSIDADDVEFLLGSVASVTGPTPAIPRFLKTLPSEDTDEDPHTPLRSSFLPSRSNLSYLSPAPPSTESSPFLRPIAKHPGNDRGSILSWEQLAQHNKSMGSDDIDKMLSDIPAPFRPGAISPAPSSLPDIPESPSLSTLPSPGGYGSISQVLLPDVTPSPAVHNTLRFDLATSELNPMDGGNITLRLQLASAENTVKEQLAQIELLKSELGSTKDARLRDVTELSGQVSVLEEQIQGNLKSHEQRQEYTSSLEEQLIQARVFNEQLIAQAVESAKRDFLKSQTATLERQQVTWKFATAACHAGAAWTAVSDAAESEMESLRESREMLHVLLAGLEHSRRHL